MIQKKTMNLSWKDFQEQAEKTDTTIIDIRTQSEILEGKLFNDALEIDYYGLDFEQRISELSPNQTYLIYCRSGGRSGAALSIFEKYELNSYDLIDGYIGAK